MRRFWTAYAVSALGSGIGAGALPLVAIVVLHASDWQVSLLAVLGGLAGVAVAVPLGPFIEFHHKRPVMLLCGPSGSGRQDKSPAQTQRRSSVDFGA
ncbi:hypothetical protein ACRYCC_34785 [Actinomadura scrupuli]|uniref:hypothetical protein n=1 Tax=Actinomadura scrupuli TaxID=559629 RepID=UPI003D957F84